MFYLIKDAKNLSSIIFKDEERGIVLKALARLLKGRQKDRKTFSFRAIKELKNRKYRTIVKTSEGEEYFISECLTVDFKDYM